MASSKSRIASVGRRLLFSAELYGKRELANHAAAGAYAFLLSATPAFLVLLFVSSRILQGSNAAADALKGVLGGVLGAETLESIARFYFSKPLTGIAAVFGIINLVWAARLFVVSIQRGLRTIWADAGIVHPVRENFITFALEFVILFSIIALLVASQASRIVISMIRDQGTRSALLGLFQAASSVLPHFVLCAFSYYTYRTVPPVRPRRLHCLVGAVLCAASYVLFMFVVGALRNTARYDLLYGVLGNLILGLINVYMFFSLYFFFAEFVYVLGSFDALLLGRYLHRSRKKAESEAADRMETSLASHIPYRLLQRYGRDYEAGQRIFCAGEEGSDVFLLRAGAVGVYQKVPTTDGMHQVSTAHAGEFFGEMAYLLGERRSATTVALTPVSVLAIPVDVFERFLAVDSRAARRLVKLLSVRLSHTTRMAAEAQARDALSLDEGERIEPECPEADTTSIGEDPLS